RHVVILLTATSVLIARLPPSSSLFPYTTLFRSGPARAVRGERPAAARGRRGRAAAPHQRAAPALRRHHARSDQHLHRHHGVGGRSEEHTSELQSRENLVCRLLLEKKKKDKKHNQ